MSVQNIGLLKLGKYWWKFLPI